jgi:hypothetical protein
MRFVRIGGFAINLHAIAYISITEGFAEENAEKPWALAVVHFIGDQGGAAGLSITLRGDDAQALRDVMDWA